jgi:integrase
MYGSGLRLTEAHRLRVKDIDLDLMQITVREGKGGKDRWVMLPGRLVPELHRQVERVQKQHEDDRRRGAGWVVLPHALARKDPTAGYDLGWQFVFPASQWSVDPVTRRRGRYYLNPSAVQRAVKKAGKTCGIPKPVTCHTLRRTFATQMLRAGYDVRSVQRVMGHRDVRTTMIYIEAITDTGVGMRSPLDQDGDRN